MLTERLRKPIVSTSANISGEEYPTTFDEINEIILQGVDYVVDWKRQEKNQKKPSSIIRLRNNGQFEFLRK